MDQFLYRTRIISSAMELFYHLYAAQNMRERLFMVAVRHIDRSLSIRALRLPPLRSKNGYNGVATYSIAPSTSFRKVTLIRLELKKNSDDSNWK